MEANDYYCWLSEAGCAQKMKALLNSKVEKSPFLKAMS